MSRSEPGQARANAPRFEPVGLLINGWEFIPEDVYQAHLPFAVPPDVKVQRLYVEVLDD